MSFLTSLSLLHCRLPLGVSGSEGTMAMAEAGMDPPALLLPCVLYSRASGLSLRYYSCRIGKPVCLHSAEPATSH